MFKKMDIYKILTLIFAVVVMISSSLSLAYPNTYEDLYKVSQFFLGFIFLFSGITEFKANRKSMAIINFSIFVLTFFVFVFTLVVRTG
ncbi:heme O synthase-like polyprenyltransferase [Paenibacillus sp. 1182]|jgi:heme O synthase-like polyprenyltransferase|nr:heme O synthase-like polyprenyltransferase [Paenibacillus sp. 1182]